MDVLLWVKRWANRFGGSIKTTLKEYFTTVRTADSYWRQHVKSKRIHDEHGSYSYRALQEEFIFEKFPDEWKDFHSYESAKIVANALAASGKLGALLKWAGDEIKSSNDRIIYDVIVLNMHQIHKSVHNALDKQALRWTVGLESDTKRWC